MTGILAAEALVHQKQFGIHLQSQDDGLCFPCVQFLPQGAYEWPVCNCSRFDPGGGPDFICAWLPGSLDDNFVPYCLGDGHFGVELAKQVQFPYTGEIDERGGIADDAHSRPSSFSTARSSSYSVIS